MCVCLCGGGLVVDVARFQWQPNDPEIVSDVLFAIANVLSIARTTYLMPAFEVLGPLQISLGRMIGDITRFLVLFTLVRSEFCSLLLASFLKLLPVVVPSTCRLPDFQSARLFD